MVTNDTLRVLKVSGETVATVPLEELSTVRALKRRLEAPLGLPRFRQRILQDGCLQKDEDRLDSAGQVQVVLLHFRPTSSSEMRELLIASVQGSADKVEAILQRPQDPDLATFGSVTALYQAARHGNVETARLLLEARADKDARGSSTASPIHVAARGNYAEVVQLLLEYRADCRPSNSLQSPLHKTSDVEVARLLLEGRACCPNARDRSGNTPLHWAARLASGSLSKLLLESRADPNAASISCQTPLHNACATGSAEIVQFLLQARADHTGTNDEDMTPLDVACDAGFWKPARLLLMARAGALPSALKSFSKWRPGKGREKRRPSLRKAMEQKQ